MLGYNVRGRDHPGGFLPDNAGLDFMFPVLVNLLPGLVPLRLCLPLPGAGLLDLDPVEGRGEGVVDLETVAWLDLLGLRGLHQDPLAGLPHGEGLEGPGELSVGDHGLVSHLLVGDLVPGVEHQQQHHLVGVDTQDLLHFTLRRVIQSKPCQPWPTLIITSVTAGALSLGCLLSVFLLAEECGVQIGRASTGLQGQDSAGVFRKIKVLEDVEGLKDEIFLAQTVTSLTRPGLPGPELWAG